MQGPRIRLIQSDQRISLDGSLIVADDDADLTREWFPVEQVAPADVGYAQDRHNPHPLIFSITSGSGLVRLRRGSAWSEVALREGDIQLFPGHCYFDELEWRFDCIRFTAIEMSVELLRRWLPGQPDGTELRHIAVTRDSQVSRLAAAMAVDVDVDSTSGRLLSKGLSMALAAHVYSRYTISDLDAVRGRRLSPSQLRRVIAYVEQAIAGDLSIAALAAQLDLSSFHFARLFKNATGLSPHQYVLQRRVQRARQLLESSSLTVAEVALAAGFSSQSHLTDTYRRITGLTPARTLRLRESSRSRQHGLD
jgi:AraC-like DNA-binding protein